MSRKTQRVSEIFVELSNHQMQTNKVFFMISRDFAQAVENQLDENASVEEVIDIMENEDKLLELANKSQCANLQDYAHNNRIHLMKCIIGPLVTLRADLSKQRLELAH